MSLDLEFDDGQQAIAGSVAQFCRERCNEETLRSAAGGFSRELWRSLAELGVLALGSEEGGGGALEIVAAVEELGRAVFPGPLMATFFATQTLPSEPRKAVAVGEAVVALGVPPLLPWAPHAQLFIEIDGKRAWSARPRGAVEPVETLGAEPWGRVELERETELLNAERALAWADVARAAYLAGAGQRMLETTSVHVATRVQFGRSIGEFQAVAHPLADCAMQLDAARQLARVAAFQLDREEAGAAASAAAARLSASDAALEAVYICHQKHGAVGFTLEGPLYSASRRVRQLVSMPPADTAARELLLAELGL